MTIRRSRDSDGAMLYRVIAIAPSLSHHRHRIIASSRYRHRVIALSRHRHRAIAPSRYRAIVIAPSHRRVIVIAPSCHRHRAIASSTYKSMVRLRDDAIVIARWCDGDDAIEHRAIAIVIVIAPSRYRHRTIAPSSSHHRVIVIAPSHHRPTSRWYDGAVVKYMTLSGFHTEYLFRSTPGYQREFDGVNEKIHLDLVGVRVSCLASRYNWSQQRGWSISY